MMIRRLALVMAAFLVWSASTTGQQAPPPGQQAPPPTQTPLPPSQSQLLPQFKSSSDVLRLDVSVLDERRMPVRGLTAADFTVLDKGKPQKVSVFTEVVVQEPVVPTTGWMRDVEPDISRNDDMNERRLIVIVLDDAQIDSAQMVVANNVKTAARAIIDQLAPSDLAAVIYTANSRNMQEFTTDRARLIAAVDRFTPGMNGDLELFQQYSVGTLRRISEFLGEIQQRRKALFYISTGVNVDPASVAPVRVTVENGSGGDKAGTTAQLISEMNEVFRQAQLANVNIHAIDPSNLMRAAGAMGVFDPRKDFLFNVSASTGGTPIVNRSDYENAIAEVFRENSSYYLLGYEPTTASDGKFHGVEVKVNRPGLTVRARSGYYAPDAIKSVDSGRSSKAGSSPLLKAISGLLPVGDIPMQVMAAPFLAPGKKEATVAIVLGLVQDVETGDTRQVEKVDFLIDAFGQDGTSKSAHGLNAAVTLKPNVKGKIGYEVLSRIDLKPGRYQVRLSAHLPSQDKSGSVYVDVEVPDFTKGALVMSGAMISVSPSLHAAPKDKLADLIAIVPTTQRYFNKTDQVTALVRLYQPKGSMKPVVMTTRVTDRNGVDVINRVETLAVGGFNTTTRSMPVRLAVPVGELPPGPYLLTFDASVGTAAAKREIRFSVQ
jgi:VWFA-related protein